jgi:prepilin-type N-terminal cleavage/methylation domain-containing protein
MLSTAKRNNTGFSLLEMAVVLVILGVLLGGLIVPLSNEREDRQRQQTEQLMEEIFDAVLGFVAANGHLPCPATAASNGLSVPAGAVVNCNPTTYPNSFVPYQTLGIRGPLNQNGLLMDGWFFPIRYQIAAGFSNTGITRVMLRNNVNLRVCTVSPCTPAPVLPERILTTNAVAVLVSWGSDGGAAPPAAQVNQFENASNNNDFVMRQISDAPSPVFNDIVTWLSPNTLALTLVDSGWPPTPP